MELCGDWFELLEARWFILFSQASVSARLRSMTYFVYQEISLGDFPLSGFGLCDRFFCSSNMIDVALRTLLALLDLDYYVSAKSPLFLITDVSTHN